MYIAIKTDLLLWKKKAVKMSFNIDSIHIHTEPENDDDDDSEFEHHKEDQSQLATLI